MTGELREVPLKSILKRLHDEKGIWFKGDESVLSKKISVRFKDLPLQKALKRILSSASYVMRFDKKGNVKGLVVVGKGKMSNIAQRYNKVNAQTPILSNNEGLTAEEQEAFKVVKDVDPPGPPVDGSAPLPEAFNVAKGISPGGEQSSDREEVGDFFRPMKMAEPPGGPVEPSPEEAEHLRVIRNTVPPGE